MGELFLCYEPIAAIPYFIENVSLNIYSIEELCYYIKSNTYMLDHSFMNEELCIWLEKQINMPNLANQLRRMMQNHVALYEFVFEIIRTTGYFSIQEMQDIILAIRQFEEKSDFECKKIRVDKMLEQGKYLNSLYEYKQLLDSADALKTEKEIIGNVWHNLGTAYARMFLFNDAAVCYQNAYNFNNNIESVKECIMAYKCAHEDKYMQNVIEKNNLSERQIIEIIDELSYTNDNLTEIDLETSNNQILEWKEEYRKNAFF